MVVELVVRLAGEKIKINIPVMTGDSSRAGDKI